MNQLLDKTRKQIEQSVPEQFQQPFLSIVTAGKKLMWSDETFHFVEEYVQGIQGPEDLVPKVATGVVKGIAIIANESKAPPDMEDPFYAAAFPAALVLACDALEYVESAKKIPITEDIVSATTEAGVRDLSQTFGITPEHLKQAYEQAQQSQRAPQEGMMDRAGAPAPPAAGAPVPEA